MSGDAGPEIRMMDTSAIRAGYREGRALGDLGPLAASLGEEGMRHRLVVNPDGTLIGGLRRWAAAAGLGWGTVACTVVRTIGEALEALEAERSDPVCAEPMTVLEALRVDLQMRTCLRWWPRAAPGEGLGLHRGIDHRGLLAAQAGLGVHNYEVARRISEAAEGLAMYKANSAPADDEARRTALELVKLLDTRDPAQVARACVRFRTGLGIQKQVQAPVMTASAARAAIAQQSGLAAGLAGMLPPAGDKALLRDMDHTLTRVIRDLRKFRSTIRAALTAGGGEGRP